jgi:hypothetical protein
MRRKYLLLMLLFYVENYAALENIEIGAKPLSLGNAMVAWQNNPYALYYNPANIYILENIYAGFTYRGFYGLPGLSQINMVTNFSLKEIPMSLGISRFGNKLYQEYQVHSGIASKISDEVTVGIGLQYYQLKIVNYGNQGSWGINLGLCYKVLEVFTLGMFVTNINQPTLGECGEKVPQSLSLGFCYLPLKNLKIGFEFYRDIRFDQNYRAGIAYDISKTLSLGLGVDDQANTFSIGLGLDNKWFDFHYGMLIHQILGISHVISIGILI